MIIHRRYSCGCVRPIKVSGLTYKDAQTTATSPCSYCTAKSNTTDESFRDLLKDLKDLFTPAKD